ncbi:hypothetical protein JZU54_01680 [bacterium]|nr:hypothetical protein [bacterium]
MTGGLAVLTGISAFAQLSNQEPFYKDPEACEITERKRSLEQDGTGAATSAAKGPEKCHWREDQVP